MIRQFINVACCMALWGLVSLSTEGMWNKHSKQSKTSGALSSATGNDQTDDYSDSNTYDRGATIDIIGETDNDIRGKHKKLKKINGRLERCVNAAVSTPISLNESMVNNMPGKTGLGVKDSATQLLHDAQELSKMIIEHKQLVQQYCQYLIKISQIPNSGNFILPNIGDPQSLQRQLDGLKGIEKDVEQYMQAANEALKLIKKSTAED